LRPAVTRVEDKTASGLHRPAFAWPNPIRESETVFSKDTEFAFTDLIWIKAQKL
jgi:hypothetical protein